MSVFHRMFGSGNNNQQTEDQPTPMTLALQELGPLLQPLPPRAPAPRQLQGLSMRPHHELPRLQVPPLSLLQPTQPQQPQLHWKIQTPAIEPPTQPQPVSRMRMVANFFSSERQQNNNSPTSAPNANTSTALPSFHEILARTKQLSVSTQEVSPADHIHVAEVPEVVEPPSQPQLRPPIHPHYAPARYSLQPPAPIEVDAMMEDGDVSMDTPSVCPSPSGSMSPSSQSGKSSKRRERWTEDEHARFMEGLNRYGRKWKKIQAFVKTKTAVQVRTHAYGYFAKLLRNMPEDDAAWELAEEMSSLPGAVLKGPASGKRRSEPKTDEAGMDVLRRFVFAKKKTEGTTKNELLLSEMTSTDTPSSVSTQQHFPTQVWGTQENWNAMESQASSVMLDLKRQRIN